MSEEEKKAIEVFNSYIYAIDTFGTIDYECCNKLYGPAKIVLNLITKQQEKITNHIPTVLQKQIVCTDI